jgi:hypothetical protein
MTAQHAARLARLVESLGAEVPALQDGDGRATRATQAWLGSLRSVPGASPRRESLRADRPAVVSDPDG